MSRAKWGARCVGAFAALVVCVPGATAVHVRPRETGLQVERLVRRLDWRDGLPVSYVVAVTQDRDGFLWVAGTGGLSRYDGTGFTRVIREGTTLISGCGETARVIFWTGKGLSEISSGGPVDLEVPGRVGSDAEWAAAVAVDGGVWWALEGRLWRRDRQGRWSELPSPAPASEPVTGLHVGAGASVFAWNHSRLWLVAPDGAAREVAAIRGVRAPLERADGSIVIGVNQAPGPVTARVFERRGDETKLLFERTGAKLLEVIQRGDRLWIATDAGYFGISENASPLYIDTAETSNASGGVFVDREGSLWSATFRGLVQLPEPETYAVSYVKVARAIAKSGSTLWMSTWGDLARFEEGGEGLETQSYGQYFGITCGDARGRIWIQTDRGLEIATATTRRPAGGDALRGGLVSCTVGPSGDLWLGQTAPQIVVIEPDDPIPRDLHASFPAGVGAFTMLREDGHGRLWGLDEHHVCSASVAALRRGTDPDWSCEAVEGSRLADLAFMPSGDVWIATVGGILHRVNGRFVPLPFADRLRSPWVIAIRPSPAGGFWIVAMGGLTRVVEKLDAPGGFEVVEDLSAWHGVPTLNGSEVIEDGDGTLWFATDAGLMKVPAGVRRQHPEPPPVALISATADARALPRDAAAELPYRRNRLELRFAALSYRDPTAIRYRHRLRDGDLWSEPTSDPLFRFVDLAPGRYRVEVEASLDGTRWSAAPAAFAFRVLKPWYLRLPFYASAALLLGVALAVAYRIRVRALLRLERQRTRIAMDLHDEVGSGLGTISVLAGLVARQELPAERRREFASRIAAVSRELSQALGDIVWSLRPGSGTLDAAWDQIVDRARPLFASGVPDLRVEAPDTVPPLPLSVVARRALFLIAIEALHNAARHSGATHVVLSLTRDGAEWELAVADDGRGLAPAPPSGRRGLGLDGMRARAAEMRAAIAWEQAAGTRLSLRFRPEAE